MIVGFCRVRKNDGFCLFVCTWGRAKEEMANIYSCASLQGIISLLKGIQMGLVVGGWGVVCVYVFAYNIYVCLITFIFLESGIT